MFQDDYKKEITKMIINKVGKIDYGTIVPTTLYSVLHLRSATRLNDSEKTKIIINSISDILDIQYFDDGTKHANLSKLIEGGLVSQCIYSFIYTFDHISDHVCNPKPKPKTKCDKWNDFACPQPYINAYSCLAIFMLIAIIMNMIFS